MNKPILAPLQHFYRTSAQPCPYLEEHEERKLITELSGPGAQQLHNELTRAGFRRSHLLAYRPACAGCSACVPVRVDVARFRDRDWTRRIRRANRDLSVAAEPARVSVEQYRLFSAYQRMRHADSDMASMSFGDYRTMVEDSAVATRLVTLRDPSDRLMGVCLTDALDDGSSAVYSYYDPTQPKRSLGTALVLALVDHAREAGQPYVYLGYWIADSRKMAYKTRFQPLEALTAQGWAPLSQ
jgi:arginine-tRNA-protein transferase